ncbi:hypothetical protein DFQ28_009319 [Apophysomyces sp. BC1034]|nr:hypothetical protein DFQ28_009319 [Apophysomyces sp. BC1034]
MARAVGGVQWLRRAHELLAHAKTAEQLKQAQAVILPLEGSLSLKQTARLIGCSVSWTCQLRKRFFAGEVVGDGHREKRGGRRRQNMSLEQEKAAAQRADQVDVSRRGTLWPPQ